MLFHMLSNTNWQIISKSETQLINFILYNPLHFGILEIKTVVEIKNTTITYFMAPLKKFNYFYYLKDYFYRELI